LARLLYTIREHRDLPVETWEEFRAKAIAAGFSPSAALSRLIRRYVAHGFDDGEAETQAGPGDG
jgi:hypothetical protein